MSLNVVVKPNADFTSGNITRALLNQAAKPTIAVAGSIGTEEIEALSITGAKIAVNTISGSKMSDGTVGFDKLSNLGRGNVLVGQAKDEDGGIDGGATVTVKLPENGFLVGDGNDVKAMVFDNSASGAISMSQYTDSSTGDTSFKHDLRNHGVKSAHIAPRSVNLEKLSPNGGTAVTDAATYSALPTYDGTERPDGTHYGLATLTSSEPTVTGLATKGLTLKSNGTSGPLSFGKLSAKELVGSAVLGTATNGDWEAHGGNENYYAIVESHGYVDKDNVGITPSFVRVVLVCQTGGDAGYAEDDEVDVHSLLSDYENTSNRDFHHSVWASKTQVGVTFYGDDGYMKLTHKAAPNEDGVFINKSKWKVKFYVTP